MGHSKRIPTPLSGRILPAIFIAALCLLLPWKQPAWAVDEPEDLINYAYSNWIGSGFYKLGDRSVYLLRAPFSYTLREADSDKWGLEMLLPATIGFHDQDEGNVGTLTFVPGLRLTYPVLGNWWLKPFGQFGFGKDFSGSDIAWIYGAGIKSLATFDLESSELDFGTGFTWAGQNQSGGGNDSGFSMFEFGLNSRWPTTITVLDRHSRQPYHHIAPAAGCGGVSYF